MPDQAVVANRDPTLILEFASGIDEDPLAQSDVLPEVRVERREDHDRFMHRFAGQLSQQLLNSGRLVIPTVQFPGDAQGILAGLMHDFV